MNEDGAVFRPSSRAGHWQYLDLWDYERAVYSLACTSSHLVEVLPMVYTDALVITPLAMPSIYADRWCYQPGGPAFDAAYAWLEKGCRGEPQGWHRHPATGRRRPDGDEAQEHVRH